MSTQSFSSVAIHVVGQYSKAGQTLVGAYRSGALRLTRGASSRYAELVNKRELPLMNGAVRTSLIESQQQLAGVLIDGVTAGAERTTRAIEVVASRINDGITRVSKAATRIEAAFDTNALSAVGHLSLPVAQLSLELASRAANGTKRISARLEKAEGDVAQAVTTLKRAAIKAAKAKTRA